MVGQTDIFFFNNAENQYPNTEGGEKKGCSRELAEKTVLGPCILNKSQESTE